jgi:hypothetical protein
LKRVFDFDLELDLELDLEHCPNCSGDLKVIATILERPAIEKILNHLGLEARAPPCPPLGKCRIKTSDPKAGPEP